MKSLIKTALLIFCIIGFYKTTSAQEKIIPAEKQAREIMNLFQDQAGLEKLFSQSFLKEVPAEKLKSTFKYYYSLCGACTKITTTKVNNDYSAKYDFVFEKNSTVVVNIIVDSKEPYLITGLYFSNPFIYAATFDDLIKELKKLPGKTSLYAAKLSDDKITSIAEYNSDSYFAIGSSFKLYILSELLREINSVERKWSDVVPLSEESVSMPSGFLHTWHTGTYMTLESLASLMISISDNTATDNLLALAGKENVEKMLSVTGHSKPQLNIPFLSTVEMFKLKGEPGKKAILNYLSSDNKRKFLAEELPKIKRENISTWSTPYYIDKVEWFASTKDLCNVMNWIRINSANENRTRNILSINPGLDISKEKWKYIGYKGGSEPGVMNMTYLLCSSKGEWFSVSCSWNNPSAAIDETKFTGFAGRAIKLLEN